MSTLTDPALRAIAISPHVDTEPSTTNWPMVAFVTALSWLASALFLVSQLTGYIGPLR